MGVLSVRGEESFRIRAITSLEELETLSERWNSLLKETKSAYNIFLTWEWLSTWARHYVEKNNLWILLVYKEENQLVGIAPLYFQRTRTLGVLKLREIRLLGSGEVCSSYLDFIVSEKHKRMVLYEIYRYLHQEAARLWDILTLSEIPAESSSIDLWNELVQTAGKVMEIVDMIVCPVIELPRRLEDFLENIGGSERYNLRRKRRRLEQEKHLAHVRASSPHDVQKELDAFIELHRLRWKETGSDGAFQSQRFLSFHRDIARVFSERGWVHLDFLLANGEKIAGVYGYSYNGRYSYYLPGFNPAIAPHASPGILLLFHCVEEAIRGGCSHFDLLTGWADYKIAWATSLRRCLTLRHYNKSVGAAATKLLTSGKDTVKIIVR